MVHQVALTAGIILFVIAIIGYLAPINYGQNVVEQLSLCDDIWVKLGYGMMGLGDELVRECNYLQNVFYGIILLGIIGIGLTIGGVAYNPKKSEETKKEDESTFKYKDEEIQPETHSQKALPEEPKSDLKKSPTQKGTIIAIIAALIVVIVIIGYASESPPQTTQQETTELNTNKESTPQQKTSPQTIQSDCDPNYSGVCIPVDSRDVDCSDFSRSFRVVGLDHHQLDRNGDGIACG